MSRIPVEVDTDIYEPLMMEAGTELNVRNPFHTDTADRQRRLKLIYFPATLLRKNFSRGSSEVEKGFSWERM
jgi:hypothetical protein